MSETVLEVCGITKNFGDFTAVDKLSFSMKPGEILGLLGPNGAGKTTVIHMILGLTVPTAGDISIFGLDLKRFRERIVQDMNFSSTYVSMPNSLTCIECLKVFARLYRVADTRKRIEEVLEMFEISDIRNKLVRHLSSGQQTRLNLAKAMINRPRLLLLDEPTASLDPDIADKTRKLLHTVRDERRISILYTSHNMKEMEDISDRLLFLHQGKLIAEGKPADIVRSFEGQNLEEVFLRVARGKNR